MPFKAWDVAQLPGRAPRRRALLLSLGALIVGFLGLEAFARLALGLGTPPLYVPHPKMEYMFKPNQDVMRFHNHLFFNEYGMRSPPLSSSHYERLVLAFGDSVLNGGSQTDQKDLGTTLASSWLSAAGRDTLVGNVSAGSWGPGNIRGWIETYGLLGAESIVLVLSSHDIADQPTFEPLDPNTHPTEAPVSALIEAVERYLPRYVPPSIASWLRPPPPPPLSIDLKGAEAAGAADIEWVLKFAEHAGVRTCLVQHLTLSELSGEREPGYKVIASIFEARGVPHIDDARWLAPRLNAQPSPYRDDIHISAAGQSSLALALVECDRLGKVPSTTR